ncbi:sensor histidine kinase [Mucilaginibacter panaciglaebae]|uniref:Signal transduction histidine kinase internal region domain-containing protein n=1 Tax=Mucilaginibacter panaciglaebae TaxID=502331 RepID=A0ABP7X2K1_9SPHI
MKKLIDNRWFLVAIPFIVWLSLLVLPFILGIDSNNNAPTAERARFITNVMISYSLLLCLFYIHTYVVYPLWDKKIIFYIFALLALLVGYWFCWHLLHIEAPRPGHFGHRLPMGGNHPFEQQGYHERRWRRDFRNPFNLSPILSSFIAILCSFCYRVILDNRARQQMVKERENIDLQSELTFLRSQISPHFMFNVLNNLVSLARKKSDKLEPSLINLSQLMRYMLYESDDNRVFLGKEVDYLKSYINLQMLRYGSNVKINLQTFGELDMYTIEPMLLIPFVENAFKHGIGMIENPVINILVSVDSDKNELHFEVDNIISPQDVSKDSNSGIGIVNVRRRLAILYPGKHNLDIVNERNTFTVNLYITLSK